MSDSLADYLGTDEKQAKSASEPTLSEQFDKVTDAKEFCRLVLESRDFRFYIFQQLTLGSLPSAIITRMMDYAWGKPVERIEHTGADGKPIEHVTEVKRTIVRVNKNDFQEQYEDAAAAEKPAVTH